ncbi:Major Facilitator Superfamily protein [Sporobacter termitidis DSM 10068]|uniref:Major Facilitator Superfamily protein n=1 Tax=Sporobacter termitidis DSM 10068 TaxID=1123282 RepID=A0A1M5Z736_9FIRM|nr:MFS transporter [Sporobacter termitidis]SHI20067.1 Major Facilitator Superfamily protein [Sporobacter termitidis DSM 10068]
MFKSVAKSKRLLMWTLFLIFMFQMPHFALSSGIDTIQKHVFTDRSLSAIQTVISLPNLLSVVAGVLSSILVGGRLATKKSLAVTGLFIVAVTGLLALVLHTQFWQLILFSVFIGLGLGFFVPASQSIMLDSFDEKERQLVSGLQFSFINFGGILMSVAGGLLITLVWYGGYIMLLVMLPVAVLSIVALPRDKGLSNGGRRAETARRSKLPADVFYYSVTLFLFTLMFNVTMSNLPTHLESHHLGNAGTAGVAIAATMAGGVFSGIFFDRLSARLRDYMIPAAFLLLFAGFTMLNLFDASLPVIFVAVFLIGISSSLCLPQCIFSSSNVVDPTNSALAATFLSCVAPGSGGFLSPVVFTNITQALVRDSTSFRYQFVGLVALMAGVIYLFNTRRREKRWPAKPAQ